jgi:DUF4097 and DUF4098 domain-containing protein YvlB
MAGYPPPYPPPPPPGYDPRAQRRFMRDQARAQRDMMRYQMRGLRRGSILGPIMLIAVGVVFLLLETGRLPHQRFWSWYGHWWPVLLVAAGAVLLAEWAFDQFHLRDPQQPQYRRSVGGGIFTLLLLFAFTGIITRGIGDIPPGQSRLFPGMHFDPGDIDQFLGDKHESDQNLDLAFPANGNLTVVNPHGDVTISGISDDNRIHIALHKQVYSRTDSEADSRAQQLVPAVTTSGSDLTITIPAIEGSSADLVISVPATAATTVTANHGDVHVASIRASVTATANHGDIDLSAVTGSAIAHINNRSASVSAHSMGSGLVIEGHADDVTLSDIMGPVSLSGDFYGTTHLEHIAGAIHFHTSRTDFQLARLDGELEVSGSDLSANQALGPVILTTSHDNVTLDRIAGDISVTNHNGSIDLTAAPTLGNITLADRTGSIKVVMPEHAGFSIQADTTNGDIDTDLPLSMTTTQGDSSRGNSGRDNHKILNGTVAPGGPLLRVTTTNGDISVHKATVAPIPPIPPTPPKRTLTPPTPPQPPRAPKSQDK